MFRGRPYRYPVTADRQSVDSFEKPLDSVPDAGASFQLPAHFLDHGCEKPILRALNSERNLHCHGLRELTDGSECDLPKRRGLAAPAITVEQDGRVSAKASRQL